MKKTILVTGATGKVGSAVSIALAARGMDVKAGVRNPAVFHDSEHIDAVHLDYDDPSTIQPALAGTDALFLMAPPLDPRAPALLKPVIDEAKAQKIKHIVLLSALGVDNNEAAPLRIVEQYLFESGIGHSIIRPNFFMDNFSAGFIAPMIHDKDGIFLAADDAQTSFIAVHDIAEVAAACFEKEFLNREFNLTGPEAISHADVAAMISEAAGRTITYQALSEEDFLQGARESGMPESAVEYMAMLYGAVRAGYTAVVTGDVQAATGNAPMNFKDFCHQKADLWKK